MNENRWLSKKYKSISIQCKIAFFSTLIAGFISHGYMFFNKLSIHDDLSLNLIGGTYSFARWFLGTLAERFAYTFFGSNIGLPVLYGFISLIFLAITLALLINLLKIKSYLFVIGLSIIISSFPAITHTFSFMFVAPYYIFAFLLSVFAVYCLEHDKNLIRGGIVGTILISLSLGIYQAYITTTICTMASVLLLRLLENDDNYKNLIKKSVQYFIVIICGILLYWIITYTVNFIYCVELEPYQGINNMTHITFIELLKRVVTCYFQAFTIKSSLYYSYIKNFYYIILILYLCIAITFTCKQIKKKRYIETVLFLLLSIILPMSLQSIYLVGSDSISASMQMAEVYIFIIMVILVEHGLKYFKMNHFKTTKIVQSIIYFGSMVVIFLSGIYYIYFNNNCYLNASIAKDRTIAWMSSLVAQIKSIDGYNDSMKILYINAENKNDITFTDHLPTESDIMMYPYVLSKWENNYKWRDFLNYFCGFYMEEVDELVKEQMLDFEEVKEMQRYPNNGSIKVIDNVIVIKF